MWLRLLCPPPLPLPLLLLGLGRGPGSCCERNPEKPPAALHQAPASACSVSDALPSSQDSASGVGTEVGSGSAWQWPRTPGTASTTPTSCGSHGRCGGGRGEDDLLRSPARASAWEASAPPQPDEGDCRAWLTATLPGDRAQVALACGQAGAPGQHSRSLCPTRSGLSCGHTDFSGSNPTPANEERKEVARWLLHKPQWWGSQRAAVGQQQSSLDSSPTRGWGGTGDMCPTSPGGEAGTH